MQTLLAVDTLDDLIHNAKRMPLSNAARVPRAELAEAVQRVRRALEEDLGDPSASRSWGALERLEELVRTAPDVPLTQQVRVDAEALYDALDELRTVLPEEVDPRWPHMPDSVRRGVHALIDTAAGPAKPEDLVAIAGQLRRAVTDDYDGFRRSRALHALERLEAIARECKRSRLSRRVRIGSDELLDIVSEINAV